MALSTASIFECNASATANNVNAGGFNPTNANFLTDLTTDTNTGNTDDPIVSSASYNFVAGDVGHWVFIKSGTNWTVGWYKISAVASNKATLMAAVGEAVQRDTAQGSPQPRYKANTVAGCATVGTPTSGTFGIDYSQGTAAIINNTDLACPDGDAAAPTVTSAGSPFGVNHVGNLIHITAGTGYTAGWYEIVSVSGTTATLDRAIGTDGAKTNGTFYVGGAMSLNSTLDDDFFEILDATSAGTGNRVFFKSGTFTLGEAVSMATSGQPFTPVIFEGYNSLRGDRPTGSSRPTISGGANAFTLGANVDMYNIIFTGSAANAFTLGSGGKVVNCKFTNTSTTAARNALVCPADSFVFGCEGVSYRGRAIQSNSASGQEFWGNYLHDSDIGLFCAQAASPININNNIIADNVTDAIIFNTNATAGCVVANNTLYGAENKLGIGISIAATATDIRVFNNIIYGFVTGVIHNLTNQSVGYSDYNDYYNNTTDVTDWQKGVNDQAIAPSFSNVTQLTGSSATSSTNVLTVGSGTPFGSVVDNQDFVYLSAGTGTGIALVKYLITAHTTTTLTVSSNITSSGSGSAITWQVTLGHNFLPAGAI